MSKEKEILGVNSDKCVELIKNNKYLFDDNFFTFIKNKRHKECSNRKSPLLNLDIGLYPKEGLIFYQKTKKDPIICYLPEEVKNLNLNVNLKSVKSIQNLKDYLLSGKDIQIFEYSIGHPISVEDSINFLNTKINKKIIPNSQKDQITDEGLQDIITLEDVPWKDLVQLREDGAVLSKESFEDLINRGTSRWQGKENVGFKSPITNTIYGNLVEFNYDNDQFFPQKPGILSISIYTDKIGLEDEPGNKKIKDWYLLTYTDLKGNNYRFCTGVGGVKMYYPINENGTKVVKLFIDSFKKGNLFAFDKFNCVRHGRVHKKTALKGAPYGYPDKNFHLRVSGELADLGSTEYTLKTLSENWFENREDPYPKEKRWIVKYEI